MGGETGAPVGVPLVGDAVGGEVGDKVGVATGLDDPASMGILVGDSVYVEPWHSQTSA